ncbi:hypothetical protein ACTFIW_003301 [Dictyostelium discoideum]
MGYFQVLINPEHSKYTALITHIGKFEYTRMPQGLVNSPSTFARLKVEIFGKIKKYFYIEESTYCSKEKSDMLKTEVDFLDFYIHKDGISPRAAKVKSISELPEPRKSKEDEAALESKGKDKKTLSDESLKELDNIKKGFERENFVKASTEMSIHSDNNNLNNGSLNMYCDVSDKVLSCSLYQILGDKFKFIWFRSRKFLSDIWGRLAKTNLQVTSIKSHRDGLPIELRKLMASYKKEKYWCSSL